MRRKLAVTLALAILAAVLGAGLASGATPVTTTTTSGQVGVNLPGGQGVTVPLPACADGVDNDGDGAVDLADPDCASSAGTSEGISPTTTTGTTTTSPSTTTTTPSTTTTTTPSSGNTSVGVSQAGEHGGNGSNGGANGQTGGVGPGKSKHQGANQQHKNKLAPPPQYQANGTPTISNPSTTIAPFAPAPIGVPNFVISQFDIPPFLLPIYQACGSEYDIPWQVLAGINKIETGFGTNLNVSSAGAIGWMQFLPSTWKAYGVDANGDGKDDPYNPVDAICAAARYLRAAGGDHDLPRAVFAYNHASWYVDEVLLYARSYGQIPEPLLGSLTGLTQDDHFPIAANSRYADDLSARIALHDSTTARRIYGNAAHVIQGSPTRRGINIYSHRRAPVVAVNDGVIRKIGRSRKLGRFIVLRDSYGNTFTYSQLGPIARSYPVPKPVKPSRANLSFAPRIGAKPSAAASKGPGSLRRPAAPSTRHLGSSLGAVVSKLLKGATGPTTRSRDSGFAGVFSKALGLSRKDAVLVPLHKGSHVAGGTVLARVGRSVDGVAPHINFSIRPVGKGAARIDPKPILDGWKLMEATAIYRAAGKNPFRRAVDIGGVLLMSKLDLERRVLADPRLQIYPCGRRDIRSGQIDRRVLATMEFLAAKGFRLAISSLKCGARPLGNRDLARQNRSGSAMDISAINGLPVEGHRGRGTLVAAVARSALQMQGTMRPDDVGAKKERVRNQRTRARPTKAPAKRQRVSVLHIGFRPLIGDGYYQDPFLHANATQGRVDMGVDYTGSGPIDAIGDATILRTGAPGWPQGGGVLYKLTDGPRAGQVIYVYEGVVPSVRAGQRVLAGQQIATFAPTGSIEIGFADASGTPLSHDVYHEGMVTPWGLKMKALLAAIEGTGSSQLFTQLLSPGQRALQLIPADTTMYEGVRVCSYVVPILQAARTLGWGGRVLSGYRSYAEQARIHASGAFSARPGESNHEGCAGGTSGPGNGAVDVTDPGSFAVAMAKLGYPLRNTLGSLDPDHFSPGGN